MPTERIRLLIVDDSAVVRKVVSDGLASDPEIEVVGTATDPYVARDKILKLNPDVITLDIEMPRMDGLTFLKILMAHRPMPVIIMSSLTQEGSAKALDALNAGAVEVLAKPGGSFSSMEDISRLARTIKEVARVKLARQRDTSVVGDAAASPRATIPQQAPAPTARPLTPQIQPKTPQIRSPETGRQYPARQIILMGASTGGTEALKAVLTALPPDLPGCCIVQHIPAVFSRAFADRLNTLCRLEVREAVHGDVVKPGLVLIAPGGFHMILKWTTAHYVVELNQAPPVHHQRPAVDVLFESAVRAGCGPHAMGILMTGMGADGAAGLLKLREAKAFTVAQNKETCVVFGMPQEAIRMGAAQRVLPLGQIPGAIHCYANEVCLAPVGNIRPSIPTNPPASRA
ncbi:MAG: chemotaxis response regulator protein-glutamate methylesterase [Verrucomicrobia bacterium]|nr:chemotaxis response regulator protein-glutamate methylesterase [Verrucomicrobiota bacterium]